MDLLPQTLSFRQLNRESHGTRFLPTLLLEVQNTLRAVESVLLSLYDVVCGTPVVNIVEILGRRLALLVAFLVAGLSRSHSRLSNWSWRCFWALIVLDKADIKTLNSRLQWAQTAAVGVLLSHFVIRRAGL